MLSTYSLYLVTDSSLISPMRIEDVIKSAIEGGVTAIQLREKNMNTLDFTEIGKRVKKVLCGKSIPLIVNDRLDVALAIDADGVHIGQNDISYTDVKKVLGGKSMIIGQTLESLDQAKIALAYDCDYFGLSSVFQSSTKVEAPHYWTQDRIKQLRRLTNKPLVGIGGINLRNARLAMRYGIDGIAVVSAICEQRTLIDVKLVAQKLKEIVESYNED